MKFSQIFVIIFIVKCSSSTELKIACTFQVVKDIMNENSAVSGPIAPPPPPPPPQIIQPGQQPPTTTVSTSPPPAKQLENVYQCQVASGVTVLTSSQKITNSSGNHLSGYTDNDVTSIAFKGKTVYYFPTGVNEIFKNILALAVTESKLREICHEDLQNFPHLRYLNLRSNELSVIESNLFKANVELETIVLSFNKIKQIDDGAFDNLPNLSNLYVEHNGCISKNATNSNEISATINEMKNRCISCSNLEIESQKCLNETIKIREEMKKRDEKIAGLEKKLDDLNGKN